VNVLDWLVIFLYFAGIVGFAAYCGRGQKNAHDYFLAGRKIKWWQSGVSTMATQLSAVSFVSAPAFVALKSGGGLKWLAYEFAVPFSLVLVMAVMIPVLHRKNHISIYAYLEDRFDPGVRALVSILFLLGRGCATGVALLAGGLILSTALSISTVSAILLIGIITLVYDVLGGIRIVVLSDVVQMIIIIAGLGLCLGIAWHLVGWDAAWAALPLERTKILHFDQWGLSPAATYGFWPMLVGGFFLYASYYGTDQSQVQRELTVENIDDVKKSLVLNALGRFPVVLLYVVMGVFVGAAFTMPGQMNAVAACLNMDSASLSHTLARDPDRMVPMFIMTFLPHGVIGLILVAIMAALMSSLDSGINSLSAVTMKDIYQRYVNKQATERHYLMSSKIITLLWGVFCVVFAILLSASGQATRQTTIVVINAVGSMLYGPVLAAFVIGMFSRTVTPATVKTAVVAGLFANITLWKLTDISWMWWNVSGFAVPVIVAIVGTLFSKMPAPQALSDSRLALQEKTGIDWNRIYGALSLYAVLIIGAAWVVERIG
jgi:SSS family transporter